MATVLKFLIFAALGWMAFQILLFGWRTKTNVIGSPPIARPAFLLAKLALALSMVLLLEAAAAGNKQPPPFVGFVVLILLVSGTVVFTLGLSRLGTNLRMGLPEEETRLVTSGIYACSRNPIYLSLFLFMGASLVYAFSWLNLVCVAATAILHHRIALSEERHLAGRFKDYEAYRRKVRRYI